MVLNHFILPFLLDNDSGLKYTLCDPAVKCPDAFVLDFGGSDPFQASPIPLCCLTHIQFHSKARGSCDIYLLPSRRELSVIGHESPFSNCPIKKFGIDSCELISNDRAMYPSARSRSPPKCIRVLTKLSRRCCPTCQRVEFLLQHAAPYFASDNIPLAIVRDQGSRLFKRDHMVPVLAKDGPDGVILAMCQQIGSCQTLLFGGNHQNQRCEGGWIKFHCSETGSNIIYCGADL